jgi:hypothetical protein
MERLFLRCDARKDVYGNLVVIGFMVVQCLDGVLTYIGLVMWGPGIEANPLVTSAVALAGPEAGLTGAKLVAASCGIVLHLLRVHGVIALLTAFYLIAAIAPWTALLLLDTR